MKLLTAKGIIGLTGYATSGKDFLFGLLAERGMVARMALADSLKQDIRPFLLDKFNIDVLKCSPEDKELIRPLLVAYGKIHRNRSEGTYFTAQITPKAIELSKKWLVVVTDVRYADPKFKEDELNWIKNIGGKLIHITKYFENPDGTRTYVSPPNEDERINNETLIEKSDYKIEWKHSLNSLNEIESHVDSVVDYLNENLNPYSDRRAI